MCTHLNDQTRFAKEEAMGNATEQLMKRVKIE